MNKTTIYSTIIASTIAVLAVFALGSSEAEAKPPSKVACPAENVQHWFSGRFVPGGLVAPFLHDTNPSLTNQNYFVPILLDSSAVIPLAASQEISDRLNELGYFVDDGSVRPIIPSDLDQASVNEGGSISVICAEN